MQLASRTCASPARLILLASVAAQSLWSCGLGSAGIAVAANGGSSSENAKPVGSALQNPRSSTSPAKISFMLNDEEANPSDVTISFRDAATGGNFKPIKLAPGSAPLSSVPSAAIPYEVLWDFAADLGGESYHRDLELQLVVVGGISPAILSGVSQGNDPPQVEALGPDPAGQGEYGGNVGLSFEVRDSAADPVRIKVEFNADAAGGLPSSGWELARPTGIPPSAPTPEYALSNVASAVQGEAGFFAWDTLFDLSGHDDEVVVRFSPEDDFGPGVPIETVAFRIDNNDPPIAILDEASLVLNPDQRRGIPLTLNLFDKESDSPHVLIQWRREGQDYPTLPSSAEELIALLEDPAREQERKEKQIAREAPIAFRGRIGSQTGADANQARLPELAGHEAGLVGIGLAGRTLEILRTNTAPAAVEWPLNPLNAPVSALAGKDGATVWVLDEGTPGWRLQEIDLETGTVKQVLASGAGVPKALCAAPLGQCFFVATNSEILRVDSSDGAGTGSLAHSFVDGPRSLAARGTQFLLATGDDALTAFDFQAGLEIPLIAGLLEPWGIVMDPVAANGAYLAERGGDRILSVDLCTLESLVVPAKVFSGDVPVLGVVPFPSPRALAVAERGGLLYVLSEHEGVPSLRGLDLRSPYDLDGDPSGSADPFVFEVKSDLTEAGGSLDVAADGLEIVSLPSADTLAVGGGIRQRRTIVPEPSAASAPIPYDPRTLLVTVSQGFSPPLAPDTPWRVKANLLPRSSPSGVHGTFVWDSSDVQGGGNVQLQVIPIDGDIGVSAQGTTFKTLLNGLAVEPVEVGQGLDLLHGIVAADLDGDGDVDLATGNGETGLSILFQSSPGAFNTVAAIVLANGLDPKAAIDLDADGDQDLLAIDNSHLLLCLQSASGQFTLGQSIATGAFPTDAAAADLNGDGLLDLVSADAGPDQLSVFLQEHGGSFSAGPILAVGDNPASVAIADLNDDGAPDLTCACGNELRLFFQDGAGGFLAGPVLATLSTPREVAVADLNGDGLLDLAAAIETYGEELSIFYQTGPGLFVPDPSPPPTGKAAFAVRAGDLDADRDIDLVLSNGSLGITQLLQTEPETFIAAPELVSQLFVLDEDLVDLDGDGDLDFAGPSDQHIALLLNASPVSLAAGQVLPGGLSVIDLALADLDADGDLDVVIDNTGESTLQIYYQSAQGYFTAGPVLPTGGAPDAVCAADLNADGRLDLVSANSNGDDLTVYFQSAGGAFQQGPSLAAGSSPRDVAAGDLNSDGLTDVIASASGSMTIYFQSPSGGFTPGPVIGVSGFGSSKMSVVDLNKDGAVDIAVVQETGSSINLFYQSPAGSFSSGPSIGTGSKPVDVRSADFDGDNDIDLAVVDEFSSDIRIFFQSDAGSFATSVTLKTGGNPGAAAVGDLDGDGDQDLVCVNKATNDLSVFIQLTPGRFVKSIPSLPVGLGVMAVCLGDLDGDGDSDLASGSLTTSEVELFYNTH